MDNQLCSFANHTFAIFATEFREAIKVEESENRVVGTLGTCVDQVLCPPEKRKCRLIGSLELGHKLSNGSFDGVLGQLQRKEIDVYFKGETEFIDEPWLKKTFPFSMERILIGHILFEDKDRPYFDLISNFSLTWELLLFYLAASSVIFLCLSLLVTLARRVGSPAYDGTATKSVFHNSLAMLKYFICEKQSLSSIEVFLLMLNVYIFLNQLFIGNNIKTEKVVVDTSEIIKSRHDLFGTKKAVCYWKDETEIKISRNAAKGSFLHRIYNDKSYLSKEMVKERQVMKNKRCIFERDLSLLNLLSSHHLATISTQTSAHFLYFMIANAKMSMDIWVLDHDTYEFNVVIYYSERNGFNEKMVHSVLLKHVENGILVKMNSCLRHRSYSPSKRIIRLFHSISDYVDEKAGFSNLALTNFQSIFLAYFLICFIIFTGYLLELSIALDLFPKFFLNLLLVSFKMLYFWKNLKERIKRSNRTAPSQTEAKLC